MELERSWSRKKMELEHSTAAGISALLRPRVGRSVAARGGWAKAAEPGQTTTLTPQSSLSVLSAEVREMLAAQRRNAASKRPRGPCHTPSNGNSAESQTSCETKAAVAPARTRQALAKRVARRMLRRRGSSPQPPDQNGTKVIVLTCCCERLPPGLHCALHQRGDAPCWPWTRDSANAVGRGWAFSEYARWRRTVWVPSRFYQLERAGVGPRDRAPPGPALLVERTARCVGVSVRRFLLVRGDPEQAGSGR